MVAAGGSRRVQVQRVLPLLLCRHRTQGPRLSRDDDPRAQHGCQGEGSS